MFRDFMLLKVLLSAFMAASAVSTYYCMAVEGIDYAAGGLSLLAFILSAAMLNSLFKKK